MKYIAFTLTAVTAGLMAAPALASDCSLGDISPAAIACEGGYAKNVLDNNSGDVATQIAALAALGYTWDGSNFGDLLKLSSLNGATNIDFGSVLHGTTYIGLHVGGKGGGQTTFYKFDAGSALDAFSIHLPSSSAAVLYYTSAAPTSPVPEIGTWAMMLGGFGFVGGAIRRRRATVNFA